MAILVPDPTLGYGNPGSPISRDQWEYIVKVHWGGPIVIAEVPNHLAYLASLTPPDPFFFANWSTTHSIGDEITEPEFTQVLTTTADTDGSLMRLVNLGATEAPDGSPRLIENDLAYPVGGDGIQSDTTFTFRGGRSGDLNKPATHQLYGSQVTFDMNWLYKLVAPDGFSQLLQQYYVLIDTSTTTPVGYLVTYAYDGSLANREHTDDYWNRLIVPSGHEDWYRSAWWDPNDTTIQPLFYNGQRLVPTDGHFGFPPGSFWPGRELLPAGGPIWATVLQVKRPFVELAQSYIINFDRTSDVAVMQMGLHSTDFILPGYSDGVNLRGYDDSTKIVVAPDWTIQVVDPATNLPVTPTWTATVKPHDPPPVFPTNTQIAHFNQDGLL